MIYCSTLHNSTTTILKHFSEPCGGVSSYTLDLGLTTRAGNFAGKMWSCKLETMETCVGRMLVWAGCLCGPDACVGRMLVWAGCLCGPDACVGRMLVWAGCLCGPDACVGRMLVWAGCLCGPDACVDRRTRYKNKNGRGAGPPQSFQTEGIGYWRVAIPG